MRRHGKPFHQLSKYHQRRLIKEEMQFDEGIEKGEAYFASQQISDFSLDPDVEKYLSDLEQSLEEESVRDESFEEVFHRTEESHYMDADFDENPQNLHTIPDVDIAVDLEDCEESDIEEPGWR